jgi:hypothetical protein
MGVQPPISLKPTSIVPTEGVECVVCISTANLISIVAEVCLFYVNLLVDARSLLLPSLVDINIQN